MQVNARKDVKDTHAAACYSFGMKNDWPERLFEAIREDGRSYRQLASDAGLGPNYVQQLMKRRSAPHYTELMKLLEAFDNETALYVHTGYRITARDWRLLTIAEGMDEATFEDAYRLFSRLSGKTEEQEQSPGVQVEAPSKLETD